MHGALQLSREQFGYVSAVCACGAVCACLPSGWLADRVGVRWLLIAGQGLSGIALGTLLRRPTYGVLLLGMLLLGLACGTTMVLTTKALAVVGGCWWPRQSGCCLATVTRARRGPPPRLRWQPLAWSGLSQSRLA